MLQKIKKFDCCDDADETGLFLNLQYCKCLLSMATPTMVKKFKKTFTVLLAFNDDGSDKTITIGNRKIQEYMFLENVIKTIYKI
jgi:hypothetical protein